ncbi:MAG: hypothetical protein ABW063_13700 [Caulobacter sp.]
MSDLAFVGMVTVGPLVWMGFKSLSDGEDQRGLWLLLAAVGLSAFLMATSSHF